MHIKHWLVATSLSFATAGALAASPQTLQGVIRFEGRIVEANCSSQVGAGSVMELKGCPAMSRGNEFSVRSVSRVTARDHSPVNLKLITDSGREGRYYDQSYRLVDSAGKPVLSGAYVVTFTAL